jgi:hypothetical protein
MRLQYLISPLFPCVLFWFNRESCPNTADVRQGCNQLPERKFPIFQILRHQNITRQPADRWHVFHKNRADKEVAGKGKKMGSKSCEKFHLVNQS